MQKRDILSVGFNLVSYNDVINTISDWRKNNQHNFITLTPPHSVLLCNIDQNLKKATDFSGLTLPDGIGIILAAKILKYPHHGRVTGPTLMLKLCEYSQTKGLKHYFYGGRPNVVQRLADRLKMSYPGLDIAGIFSPPFRNLTKEEDQEIIKKINDVEPDIIWVGLGSPKQEKWMADHIKQVNATAMIGVGAAFDFHSGLVKWAPKWMRNLGIEWAYRLAHEPKKMLRRNMNSFVFVAKIMRQKFRSVPYFNKYQ